MRSNTVPVKPQQLHYPPEGGRGKRVGECVEGGAQRVGEGGQIKRECVRISVNEKQIADQEFRALLN